MPPTLFWSVAAGIAILANVALSAFKDTRLVVALRTVTAFLGIGLAFVAAGGGL